MIKNYSLLIRVLSDKYHSVELCVPVVKYYLFFPFAKICVYPRFIKDLKNSVSSVSSVVKTPTPSLHLANAFPPCSQRLPSMQPTPSLHAANAFPPCSQRLPYFLQIPLLPSKYFPCKTSGITRILVTFDPFL